MLNPALDPRRIPVLDMIADGMLARQNDEVRERARLAFLSLTDRDEVRYVALLVLRIATERRLLALATPRAPSTESVPRGTE